MSEIQLEEQEVLQSIYDADSAFYMINATTYQYRFGDEGAYKSFNIEVTWPEQYPDCEPEINLETFYNGHVVTEVKTAIVKALQEEANNQLGSSMTFTLIEMVRDKLEEFLELQPESTAKLVKDEPQSTQVSTKVKKKEQMTKAQKRKHFDRVNNEGEMPRGYNWVSLIRHLQQTGSSS